MLNRVSNVLVKLLNPVSTTQEPQKQSGVQGDSNKKNQEFERHKPKGEATGNLPSESRTSLRVIKTLDPAPQKPLERPHEHASVSSTFVALVEKLKAQRAQIGSWLGIDSYNKMKKTRSKKHAYRKGTVMDESVE